MARFHQIAADPAMFAHQPGLSSIAFKKLAGEGFISGRTTQDKNRERVEFERDLAIQRTHLAVSALKEAQQAKAAPQAETRRSLSDRQAQAVTKQQQFNADDRKADQRQRLTQLTALANGVIQQLAIHSISDVVTSAQPLMVAGQRQRNSRSEHCQPRHRLCQCPSDSRDQAGDFCTRSTSPCPLGWTW